MISLFILKCFIVHLLFVYCRMRILLLNTFNLAEDAINKENMTSWISVLNHTDPEKLELIQHKIESCSLEAELDTVCACVCACVCVH